MVSKVSKLVGKGEKLTFETENGDVEFVIKPLKNKELLEVVDLAEKKDTKKMLTTMLKLTLIKDDPEITDNDIDDMPAAYLMDILRAITKVNHLEGMFDFQLSGQSTKENLSKPASKEELLERLKQRVGQRA